MLRFASSPRTDVLCDQHRGRLHSDSVVSTSQADAWDSFVHAHPDGTIFHTQGWRNAVSDTFGHKPVYLSVQRGAHAHDAGKITGVLPLFEVRSLFLGRMLVSVPYGVGGGLLTESYDTSAALFDAACEVARDRRCRGIDMRSEAAMLEDVPVTRGYVGFKKTLPDSVDDVLLSLPRKARAAARQARRKYELTISYGARHLPDVYRLYAHSMRRLGSPNYPFRFFEALTQSFKNATWVALVRWQGTPVAGLVTFLFRDSVMPYFVGLSDKARECHAANFIYLCTMERAVARGFSCFDFGRSRTDNTGSYDFKRFQGFSPRPLGYQFHTLPGQRPVSLSASSGRFALARSLWKRCPVALTQSLGAKLSYHFPG